MKCAVLRSRWEHLQYFSVPHGGRPEPKPPARSALDKAVLEDYVRHLFVWGPQIQVKVSDPKAFGALSRLSTSECRGVRR